MISKTAMIPLVKAGAWSEVEAALAGNPKLLGVKDDKGRNWLHLCCGVDYQTKGVDAQDLIRTAKVLLKAGIDINQEAFREGNFRATPLWYSVSHGRNLALAQYLLEQGSDPNHCLFAAAWNEDPEAIRLLIRNGADINGDDDDPPFLGAIQWSKFAAAEELLKLGSDVNFQDSKGMTALHYMLKKGSEKRHIQMLIKYGARGDIPNANGDTAAEIMMRKKDPEFRTLAGLLGKA